MHGQRVVLPEDLGYHVLCDMICHSWLASPPHYMASRMYQWAGQHRGPTYLQQSPWIHYSRCKCVLKLTLLDVHMCVHMCRCVLVCVHKYAVACVNIKGQRSLLGVFYSCLLPYVLRIVFHWDLRLADLLRRLASLWGLSVSTSPGPRLQVYIDTPSFLCGCWGSKPRSV